MHGRCSGVVCGGSRSTRWVSQVLKDTLGVCQVGKGFFSRGTASVGFSKCFRRQRGAPAVRQTQRQREDGVLPLRASKQGPEVASGTRKKDGGAGETAARRRGPERSRGGARGGVWQGAVQRGQRHSDGSWKRGHQSGSRSVAPGELAGLRGAETTGRQTREASVLCGEAGSTGGTSGDSGDLAPSGLVPG